ncbi:MAG: membrane protein insertion efficiency factor YidD [Myxococcales bacterium]|nr:membrane protein insertion efficiency factor YidD [Myxococcales bacterium]
MASYPGQRLLRAGISGYRRFLSGRGPLRRVRCTFEACESCSAFGLRACEEADGFMAALRRIRARLRRCGGAAVFRDDDGALSWGLLYDEPEDLPRALAEAGELAVSEAAILRMAARVARARGIAGAQLLFERAGQGPELLLRRGGGFSSALRRLTAVRVALILALNLTVLVAVAASSSLQPRTWLLIGLCLVALDVASLWGLVRRLRWQRLRRLHFEAARHFEAN